MQNNEPWNDEIEEENRINRERLSIRQIDSLSGKEGSTREHWPSTADSYHSYTENERYNRARRGYLHYRIAENGDNDKWQETVAENADTLEETQLSGEKFSIHGDYNGA